MWSLFVVSMLVIYTFDSLTGISRSECSEKLVAWQSESHLRITNADELRLMRASRMRMPPPKKRHQVRINLDNDTATCFDDGGGGGCSSDELYGDATAADRMERAYFGVAYQQLHSSSRRLPAANG